MLPVLPVVLAGGASGGRRRPVGIALGLAATFTVSAVLLAYVISWLGLPDQLVRWLAIGALVGFGVVLLVPAVAARVEGWLASVARIRAPSGGGDGFAGGVALGAALGFVYAPCAGPVLAGVVTVTASQSLSPARLVVGLAYAVGAAAVLLVLMLAGRRLIARLSRRSGRLQQGMGAVMVVVAVLMVFELDLAFQRSIADDLPAAFVNPTGEIEKAGAVRRTLGDDSRRGPGALVDRRQRSDPGAASSPAAPHTTLERYGQAPEFVGNQRWFNSKPLTLAGLRGRVVLIDFWTYTCINCLRTLPHLRAWDERYRSQGLTIVGVHTPEFAFEKDAGNVARAIRDNGLRYPVAQDNDRLTWDAWANQYWPAKYLIDATGQVRYAHFGEGDYEETEAAIQELLGARTAALVSADVPTETASDGVQTPETYLGSQRAEGFVHAMLPGTETFGEPPALARNRFALVGRWRVGEESATAVGRGAQVKQRFTAEKVFLVLSSAGGQPRSVRVSLDGRPLRAEQAGEDVRGGRAVVRGQRLYRLVDLPAAGEHVLALTLEPGVSAFAFTYG